MKGGQGEGKGEQRSKLGQGPSEGSKQNSHTRLCDKSPFISGHAPYRRRPHEWSMPWAALGVTRHIAAIHEWSIPWMALGPHLTNAPTAL